MAAVLDEKLVEKIVGEVMTRIRPTSQPVRAEVSQRPATTNHQPARPSSLSAQPSALLVITDRVVTAELLSQRLAGKMFSAVAICPKSIITPSAFDFLRTKKIFWHRNTAEAAPKADKPMTRWKAFVVTVTPSVLQAVEHTEQQTFGKQWSHELLGSADEAITAATSAINRGEANGIAVFADHAELIERR